MTFWIARRLCGIQLWRNAAYYNATWRSSRLPALGVDARILNTVSTIGPEPGKKKNRIWRFLLLVSGSITGFYFGKVVVEYFYEFKGLNSRQKFHLFVLKFFFPHKVISWVTGLVSNLYVPVAFRSTVYKIFANYCNIYTENIESLKYYRTLNDFFTRRVDMADRPLSDSPLTSPVDGMVLECGSIVYSQDDNEADKVLPIKGINYPIRTFLGELPALESAHSRVKRPHSLEDLAKKSGKKDPKTGNKLFYCILYLHPSDYHHFYSPTDWKVTRVKHFAGELFSVSPKAIDYFNATLHFNERYGIFGRWKEGFFCMVPVGATNVGSISLDSLTNEERENLDGNRNPFHFVYSASKKYSQIDTLRPLRKGELVGHFRLGSTVVLFWEAKGWKFDIDTGQKVVIGQSIGESISR